MEGIFYEYQDNFVKKGKVIKDKNNNIFRMNTNENNEIRGSQIQLDKNGELLSIRYVDDLNNAQTLVYKDGVVLSKFQEKLIEGKFLKNGTYEQYDKNGKVVKLGNYFNGKEEGNWIEVASNNNIIYKRYKNGEDISALEGKKIKENFLNSGLATIDTLTENDPIIATKRLMKELWKFVSSFENENIPQIKINFKEMPNLEIGKKEYCYATFYKDGSPKIFAEEAIKDSNEKIKFTGSFIEHYDNGKIKIKCSYNSENNLEGKYSEYYENGVLKYEGEYKNGEKRGIHREFDKSGLETYCENFDSKEKREERFLNNEKEKKKIHDKEKRQKNFIKKIEINKDNKGFER